MEKKFKELIENLFTGKSDADTYTELANIMKYCKSCITVDTGTLHFANALNIPVVGIFYDGHTEQWGSDTTLYPAKILDKYHSPKEIYNTYKSICGVLS